MTALWIILGILGFFVFLFSIPIHIFVEADSDVRVWAQVLFVKYSLFPMKKRKKKSTKKGKQKKKSVGASKKNAKKAPDNKPKPKRDIIGLIKLVWKLAAAVLKKFPKHFRVCIRRYEITVGTADAAKTAILYGTVTGLSANLFAFLRKATKFKIARKAPVNVYADFTGEKTTANICLDFSMTLTSAFAILIAAGLAFVKSKLQNQTSSADKKRSQEPIQTKK